ncbi:MAG: hypothetical protein RI933_465 [Actinomycetota bacterium]|jgi:hypothetical protein
MNFAEINWLAVLIAGVVGIVVGALWFGPKAFYPIWWTALGQEPTDQPGDDSMAKVFGITFAAAFVQAITLAILIQALGVTDFLNGALLGALVGFGIGAATSVSHRLFGRQGLTVWLIEVGQDIVGLTLMGAIIAGLG